MKSYKLKAWPDLPPAFRRTAYRRALSQLSHRHATENQLCRDSGLSVSEWRQLLGHLDAHGLVDVRDVPDEEVRIRPHGTWARLVAPLQQWRMRRAG